MPADTHSDSQPAVTEGR